VFDGLSPGTYAVRYVCGAEGTYTATVRLRGEHVRGSPVTLTCFKNVAALAEQEIDRRLASTVASLRQGVGQARQLHRALQAESASLAAFIPVLVRPVSPALAPQIAQRRLCLL